MLPDRTALQVSAIVDCQDDVCQQKLEAMMAELEGQDDLDGARVLHDLERHLIAAGDEACSNEDWEAAQLLITAIEKALERLENAPANAS